MARYLVTGGAGFIGSHVAETLADRGDEVCVLDDLSTGKRENLATFLDRVEFVEGSICSADTTRHAMRGADCVFHLAARGSVPRSVDDPVGAHDVNVNGTLNVLMAARELGVRRVVFSASSSAYGDTPTLPKHEEMTPQPLSPYAATKLTCEHYCAVFAKVYGLETVSLRYFNVFGPRQDPQSDYAAVLPAFISHMLRGERPIVYGDGEQTRDFCYIENVVRANLLASECDAAQGQAVNIACGERTSLNEILKLINGHLNTSIEADYRDPRPGDVKHSLAALDAARELIGYEPEILFAEGLSRSIDWYRANLA